MRWPAVDFALLSSCQWSGIFGGVRPKSDQSLKHLPTKVWNTCWPKFERKLLATQPIIIAQCSFWCRSRALDLSFRSAPKLSSCDNYRPSLLTKIKKCWPKFESSNFGQTLVGPPQKFRITGIIIDLLGNDSLFTCSRKWIEIQAQNSVQSYSYPEFPWRMESISDFQWTHRIHAHENYSI